jgi:hypothetical protein
MFDANFQGRAGDLSDDAEALPEDLEAWAETS